MMAVFMMSGENRRREITHPLMAVGTDGFGLAGTGPANDLPAHPRSFGTFPRILGRYCRQEGLLPLEEAVFKMTGLPARYLGLKDRGTIKAGLAADITVFNPRTSSTPRPTRSPTPIPSASSTYWSAARRF